MSPSEELKAAAEKIRAVADLASVGPWEARPVVYGPADEGWGEPNNFEVYGPGLLSNRERCVVSHVQHEGGGADETDARHIALWDPPTAFLVADLLDGMAAHWASRPIADLDIYLGTPLCKLARHILGGAS